MSQFGVVGDRAQGLPLAPDSSSFSIQPGRVSGPGVWLLCLAVSLLGACGRVQAPPCPLANDTARAPSAGCFVMRDDGLLLVQGMNNKVSLPGGSSLPDEPARCTAHRETWEETGLRVQPGRLLAVFDTGFHLYQCNLGPDSGVIDPPPRFEVRAAFFAPVGTFGDYEWRFGYQRQVLAQMLLDLQVEPLNF